MKKPKIISKVIQDLCEELSRDNLMNRKNHFYLTTAQLRKSVLIEVFSSRELL